ncbi:MAG: hypothetical protein R3E08_13215 [Thiotrichaceae bacterium]
MFKELYESNPKSEGLKNGLAISYEKLGDIHQALGHTDTALEFFELETRLFKELYESNPKSVALKNGLAISYYKLGGIYQAKRIAFYRLSTMRENYTQVIEAYKKAIALWTELCDDTQIEAYHKHLENAEQVYLQLRIVPYALLFQLTVITLIGGLYWIDWLSIWWLIGSLIWFFPLRLPIKTVLFIKIPLIILLILIARL